ncbi:uncharacterized protein [Takifugu rubripes]|uniref:Uncharacterized LOC105417636 n=1 Tax=Takifugu rubripes TaxID=31033 RepID=A0A674N490_TAKRU|nr:uncharacterized protein LOC105417636 [Takifugu rubripes]
MEDFDTFVQRCVSCLSKKNDTKKPPSTTSVIRFYGQPILPPLLTEAQRAEMQQHREEAQAAAVHRRTKASAQLASVQATRQREQLCRAPTLEGLRHESETDETSLLSHDSGGGSVLGDGPFTGTNEHLLFSSPPEDKGNDESRLSAAECERHLFSPARGRDEDHNFDRHGGSSDNPDFSEALSTNHSPAADLHTGQEPTENKSEHNVDLGEGQRSLRPFSELLQEGEVKNDGLLLPATESLLVPESKEHYGASVPPLEVTTHSALCATPQPEYQEKCLIDQQVSHPDCCHGHQPAVCDHLENTTSVSRGSEGKERHAFVSSEGADDVGSLFQHSPSDTIAKTPNIICYPPLDGGELERSGLESWFGYGFVISKGISHSLVMPDPLADGKCDPHLYSAESKGDPPLASVINHNKDPNPESLQSLTTPQSPTVQRAPAVTQADKAKPHCINLQALLKRSQEYRQHQKMLRNKGKNREVQVKTRDLARARADQQSLSKGGRPETTDEGKPKEKKSTFIPGAETKESWEKHKTTETRFLCNLTRSENTQAREDGHAQGIGENPEETTVKNDAASISQEVAMTPKHTSPSPQQHPKGARKYHMTRAATFSHGPDYRKSGSTKGSRQLGESRLGNKEQQVNKVPLDHRDGSAPALRAVDPVTVSVLPKHPATSSPHIDLIETSLCGLKAQILDLESTLKENLEDRSPDDSDVNLELGYIKGTQRARVLQSDCAPGQDGLSHGVTDSDPKCLRRQLLKEMMDAEENPGPEASDGEEDPPVIGRKGPQLVSSDKEGLIKTLDTEEAMQSRAHEEEPLTGKGGPHEAQQDRIAEVSQNVSSETEVSAPLSVLCHTGDHPEEDEATVGCHGGQPEGHPSLELRFTPETGEEFQGRGPALALSPGGPTWISVGPGCQKSGQVLGKQSAAHWPHGDASRDGREQQAAVHGAGAQSLLEEHGEQQEERLQPGFTPPQRFRPLLLAAAKGFLTRRLLKTQRVKKLVDATRDMQQLLNTLQQPNSLRKEIVTLKALLHLNAARSEISDIFFDMSTGARMQIISQDRELIHNRELRRKSVEPGGPRKRSCLSAATQKSLEEKRERLMAAIKSKAASQGQLKANCVRL